ncbi:MAG: hypothetical protein ABII09_03735 [Planctomycetota bacterium]
MSIGIVERQLGFSDLLLNPSVPVPDERRLKKQAVAVFNRLNNRAMPRVSNVELAEMAMQYNARIWEIRRWLEPQGWTVVRERNENGLNYYHLERS